MTYIERSTRALDGREQVLCPKSIPLVELLLKYHSHEGATWDQEDEILKMNSNLFDG